MTRYQESSVRVFGIVPAAGQSRRMESDTPKQLLPVGDRIMLDIVIETMLDAGLDGLAVVTRSDVADELDLTEDPRFITAINDDPDTEMIDSIRIGLAALAKAVELASDDGVLVCPGDMPDVPADAIRQAAEEYSARPGWIISTTHRGQNGHPIVVPLSLRSEIESAGSGGLKHVRDAHPELTQAVEFDSAGVLRDVDTQADLDGLDR